MRSRHILTIPLLTISLVTITILAIETPFHSVHAEPAPAPPRAPTAPGDVALEFVSYLGGANDGLAVQGDYAYTGFGRAFVVVDISDPLVPREVGVVGAGGLTVAISDTLAYVGQGDDLLVVDIVSPTHPVELGSTTISGMDAIAIALAGRYAYVAGRGGGLRVVDVLTATAPVRVTNYVTPEIGATRDIVVVDGCAFMTTLYSGEFFTVDVSDLGGLRESGRLKVPEDPTDVVAVGDTVYVFDWGLTSIDISDPASPVLSEIAISGDYAYVVGHDENLLVIDVSDPTAPAAPVSRPITGRGKRLFIDGDTAYLATDYLDSGTYIYYGVISVVDISNPTAAYEVTTYRVAYDYAETVYAAGDYAYLIGQTTGLHVLRIVPLALEVTPQSMMVLAEAGGGPSHGPRQSAPPALPGSRSTRSPAPRPPLSPLPSPSPA